MLIAACGAGFWLWTNRAPHFLPVDSTPFVAQFAPPPADGSVQTRAELDELLAIQASRTAAARDSARADRKKDLRQFYGALGVDPAATDSLTPLRDFMDRVEDDVSRYVRDAKHRFVRPRPYVIEARLKPCIDAVADNLSYPSGHSTYGYVMALVLADMVPERRTGLLARADSFAHSRMVCGVHYLSDIVAGRQAAEWLVGEMRRNAAFREQAAQSAQLLRGAVP